MILIKQILTHLQKNPDQPWIHEVHDDHLHTLSKKEFYKLFASAKQKLIDLGIKQGDRIVLLGSNSAQWIACDLAILSVGAITVPLYSRQDPTELAYMAQDCQPTLFISSTEELKLEVFKHWKTPCKSILLDEFFSAEVLNASEIATHPSAIATIIYTSGTSGHPKGVMLSGDNIDFMIERTTAQLHSARSAYMGRGVETIDRVFHFLPLCFAGSRLMLWTQLYRGNPVHLSTDLKNLVQEMATAAPEFYLNVPAILERIRTGVGDKIREKGGTIAKLYETGMRIGHAQQQSFSEKIKFWFLSKFIFNAVRKKIGTNLKFLICGSAALHPDTQKWFNIIGIPVLQVYGLTETTAIITMDQPGEANPGYVGKPIDGIEIKISQDGELLSKGPHIFQGYWNRSQDFQESFVDGWFRTGDLVEIANDGNLRITGRCKNLIIPTSGHNVVPEPIEEMLQKNCSKIDHAVLIGHGKPFLSVIVTGNVSSNEIESAIEKINSSVPHYRKIKTYFHHKDGFTIENGLLTANQKLKRKAIENFLNPHIEKMYTQVRI